MQLTAAQEKIYELTKQGITVKEIARRLRTTQGIVNAQLTRIRKKDVDVPGVPSSTTFSEEEVTTIAKEKSAAAEDALIGQAEEALAQAKKIGTKAILDKDSPLDKEELKENLEQRLRTCPNADHYLKLGIHPFLQFDVVIKFTKLFGGREGAHQAIEDVFDALRSFLGVKDPKRVEEDTEG